jgi:hypothetical protein
MGAATYTATAGVRCTWDKDVKRNGNGHSDPADLIGGKTPDRALCPLDRADTGRMCKYKAPLRARACCFCPLVFLYTLHWENII